MNSFSYSVAIVKYDYHGLIVVLYQDHDLTEQLTSTTTNPVVLLYCTSHECMPRALLTFSLHKNEAESYLGLKFLVGLKIPTILNFQNESTTNRPLSNNGASLPSYGPQAKVPIPHLHRNTCSVNFVNVIY